MNEIVQYIQSITWADVYALLGFVGACVVGLTPIAAGSRKGALWLHERALTTPTKADEAVTSRLVRFTDGAAFWLAVVGAYLPRVTNDVRAAQRMAEAIKPAAVRR